MAKHHDSRIIAQSGEGVYDVAGQVMKSNYGSPMAVGVWKKWCC